MSIFDNDATVSLSPATTGSNDSRPSYEYNTLPMIDYPTLFEAAFTPHCYCCGARDNLQCITVGSRAGKHICGRCLDAALRSMDGE